MADESKKYHVLTPKTDLGESEYFKAIEFALEDKSVHNLAISGPYGAGKSSVIHSFINTRKNSKDKEKKVHIGGEWPINDITITLGHLCTSANVRCKYVLQRLNCYYEVSDVPDDQLTIEHLLPEKFGGIRYNIGNLIALEDKLNNEAGSAEYSSKLSIYGRSRYKWMTDFTTSYPEWDESMIDDRAAELAKVYYYDILKRPKVD